MRRASAIGLATLLVPGLAAADGVTGLIEEQFLSTRSTVTDQAGRSVRNDADEFVQRYRLAVNRSILPLLRVDAGGVFEQFLGTTRLDQDTTDLHSRTTNFFATLTGGTPFLGAAVGYNRRDQTAGTALIPFGFVSDEWDAQVGWKPLDLPQLSLRLSRPSIRDRDRIVQDLTTNEALFDAIYSPVRPLEVRYAVDVRNPVDRIKSTESVTVLQTGRATYDDRWFEGRSTVAASVNLSNQRIEVVRAGPAGTVTAQQSPIAGYSLVERFPATPSLDVLAQNGALVNGDTAASAGINIGTSASLAGDDAYRDLGAQFGDTLTAVNTIWVWIDRQLPPAAAAALIQQRGDDRWTVWQSNDNQTWTKLDPAGAIFPNPLSPRFEIPIPTVRARYLKVIVKPLSTGDTADPAFRDVFVTEIQLYLTSAAANLGRWQSTSAATASLSARTQILREALLAHDVSVFLTGGDRLGGGAGGSWLLINGLTSSKRLGSIWMVNARVARQDADQSRGHEGEWLYSASLGVTPFPTLTGNLVYSGRYDTTPLGNTSTNTLALFGEATPYRGIGLLGYASYGVSGLVTGQSSAIDAVTLGTTLQPHPNVTLTGTFGHSSSVTTGGGLPRSSSVTNRVDATATFSPVQALYFSGGITRLVTVGAEPATLANGTVSFSPFRGGDLQFGLVYTQTLEADRSITRLFTPSVRWNIRRMTLTTSWNVLRTESTTQPIHSNTFTADLRIPL